MSTVVNVALPVFAIILAGYLGGRARLLGDTASQALNQFVYWFALPPVLFLGTAERSIGDIFNGPFIGAFLGSMLIVYALGAVLGWAIHRERAEIVSMQALNACFSNTGYMGIPLFLAAFGQAGLAPAILATVIMGAVMTGIAVMVLEFARSAGRGPGRALADVATALARNPLVVAVVAGIVFSALDLPVPAPLGRFGELLGAAAGPCALFAIGLFLAGRPLAADLGEVGWIVALKLVSQPLIAWALVTYVFMLDPFWAASAVLLAALPTGSLTFVIAQQYRIYVERTSAVILLSTILSVITISFLLAHYAPPP